MLEIAGGIILAGLFFVFLPYIVGIIYVLVVLAVAAALLGLEAVLVYWASEFVALALNVEPHDAEAIAAFLALSAVVATGFWAFRRWANN